METQVDTIMRGIRQILGLQKGVSSYYWCQSRASQRKVIGAHEHETIMC